MIIIDNLGVRHICFFLCDLMARLLLPLLLLLSPSWLSAQNAPFSKGVNLTGWFQAPSIRQVQFSRYTLADFQQIQSLGCDVVRLPINLHFMTDGAPTYQIDPLLYVMLDQVVDWADQLGMHLILDNHTFDPAISTDPAVGTILAKVWKQMAAHYQDHDGDIYYEILNEPHGISDALWGSIQGSIIDTIRTVDTTHTIIVGGAGWNGYANLAQIPIYPDDNLIYTFHFYDPFIFTHQGASWTDPSMVPLANVPFPYNPGTMPPVPPTLAGSWIGNAILNYQADGTVQKVQELIDIAVQFQQARQVPVFCGEFGVFIPNSQQADRVFWYDAVRTYLESQGIAWTMWDYHGGFGLYNAGGNDLFDHDLNTELLTALGFTVPPQTPYIPQPDSVGRLLYDDFLGPEVYESSYGSGTLDYYSSDNPNNDQFCIKWENAGQYEHIGLDFVPNRDLSELLSHGYALDLMVRGDMAGTSFDIRFLDTKTSDPNDHPWRMRVTISDADASWDLRWHHLHIPLGDFAEHGSWDNNTWYPPEGKFDWTTVDRLEIVAEHQPLQGVRLWFDQIAITNLDTAMVRDTSVFSTSLDREQLSWQMQVYPNPCSDRLSLYNPLPGSCSYRVIDAFGRSMVFGTFYDTTTIEVGSWPAGVYTVQFLSGGRKKSKTLIVMR